jgi:hypothetical protein
MSESTPFVDGFVPAIAEFMGSSEQRMAGPQARSSPGLLRLVDGIDATLVDELHACAHAAGCPLGVYVSTAEVLGTAPPRADAAAGTKDAALYPLALRASKAIFADSGALDAADLANVHGFMCWCLEVGEGSSVTYHIDYGESLRYETSLIVPPLYGAVLHCSDLASHLDLAPSSSAAPPAAASASASASTAAVDADVGVETLGAPTRAVDATRRMEGGVYYVNRGGLAHYSKWGFKGKLLGAGGGALDASGDAAGVRDAAGQAKGAKAKARDAAPSPEALLARLRTEEGACSFMYRYILRESCLQFDSLPLTSLTIRKKAGCVCRTRTGGLLCRTATCRTSRRASLRCRRGRSV